MKSNANPRAPDFVLSYKEMQTEDRLESWKEIATYLGKGVRTVTRWEKTEGLPVHRHQHERRPTVYALKPELDAWRLGRRRAAPVVRAAVDPRRWHWPGWLAAALLAGLGAVMLLARY